MKASEVARVSGRALFRLRCAPSPPFGTARPRRGPPPDSRPMGDPVSRHAGRAANSKECPIMKLPPQLAWAVLLALVWAALVGGATAPSGYRLRQQGGKEYASGRTRVDAVHEPLVLLEDLLSDRGVADGLRRGERPLQRLLLVLTSARADFQGPRCTRVSLPLSPKSASVHRPSRVV